MADKMRIPGMYERGLIVGTMIVLCVGMACSTPGDETKLTGPYLGQVGPGEKAVIFAPGIISTGLHDDAGPSFTRDGREILFRIAGKPYGIIGSMKEVDGVWTEPVEMRWSNWNYRVIHCADGLGNCVRNVAETTESFIRYHSIEI